MSNARNLADAGVSAPGGLAPTGVVLPFSGATAPSGWLLCFGQAVSRTTYSALFAVLGTTHGAGDGSTTFALPDLRGRVPGGKDNMGGTAASRLTTGGSGVNGATLGSVGGAEIHTLSTTQMPSHSHGGSSGSGGGHSHTVAGASSGPTQTADMFGPTALASAGTQTTSTAAAHTHTITAEGGGGAHNNTQPTIVLNYIIKT